VSALRLPLLRGIAIPVLLAQLKMARVKIIAAIGRGVVDSRQDTGSQETQAYPDLREASAIFVGNEGAGLAPEVLHSADGTISIPMHPSVESLNAGVAASIALFEAARQRHVTR
jgi:TrmH family RNA methyltransferase